jgi:hypothetical protein
MQEIFFRSDTLLSHLLSFSLPFLACFTGPLVYIPDAALRSLSLLRYFIKEHHGIFVTRILLYDRL